MSTIFSFFQEQLSAIEDIKKELGPLNEIEKIWSIVKDLKGQVENVKVSEPKEDGEQVFIERVLPFLTHLQICEAFQSILGDNYSKKML